MAVGIAFQLCPATAVCQDSDAGTNLADRRLSGQSDRYVATTTANPGIPIDQLQILVRPLTKSELQVEADAWFKLLRVKAAQVAAVRLGAKKATQALVSEDQKVAQESIREAAKIVDKAADKAEQTEQAIVEEAAAESGQTARRSEEKPAANTLDEAATDLGLDASADDNEPQADENETQAEPADVGTDDTDTDAKTIDTPSDSDQPEPVPADDKTDGEPVNKVESVRDQLLDDVTALQGERTALSDRLEIVLMSLELKGGDVQEYRDYIYAISGIELDTSDVTSAWSGLVGWLRSKEGGQRWAWNIVRFLVILLITWIMSRIVAKIVNWLLDRKIRLSQLAERLISQTVKNAVLAIGFAVALTALEIDITPIVAAIGATGLVIGLALQGTLSNFASGLMILINRPFDVGHVVTAGGITGTIDQMNLVSTRFRTFDNQTIYVPNNEIWNNVITNITANANRRVDMEFGISYGDDFEEAEAIIKDIVNQHELVLEDPEPAVVTHALADSSVNIVCRPWAKTSDWWTVKTDVTRAVKKRFDEAGITIPYPQQDIHIHQVLPKPAQLESVQPE
ncbi:mechanosensitive ion channel protein MscS [Rhodopirellula sp. MGV]|nr:mechanosensitive ion channel protein MscS [Rhodopirellula sp. MGV]PNY35985.1 mechanosensitive ion channel protein MscS [Rhodopirellula baltica]